MPCQPLKPAGSLSLDLDNKWSYLKTRGDAAWVTYPSYLDVVVPRVLAFLSERKLRITFFVVGQDALLAANKPVLRRLAEAGHEIGNHSLRHEPWLHLYSRAEIAAEVAAAETAIEGATGYRPRGFRGPGFSVSDDVISVLLEREYLYDASTLPTFIGPLARLYYFFTARLEKAEKKQRAQLFGTLRDGFRLLRPHEWKSGSGSLLEVPVTTIPVLRTPFHLSYLLYLAGYSRALATTYLQLAVTLCRWSGVAPSFLLHPLDFLGPQEAPELAFFPGMQMSLSDKLAVASEALETLGRHFDLLTMEEHARACRAFRARSEAAAAAAGQ